MWINTHQKVGKNKLTLQKVQKRTALRSICGYRTISYVTANILAGMPPIELLAEERGTAFSKRRVKRRKATDTEKPKICDRTLTKKEISTTRG